MPDEQRNDSPPWLDPTGACAHCPYRQATASTLRVADLTLDLITRKVERAGQPIELALREFDLLAYLMRRAGQVCKRQDILEQAWGYRFDPGTTVLDTNINRLRAKMDTGFETRLIHAVRGIGYRLGPV